MNRKPLGFLATAVVLGALAWPLLAQPPSAGGGGPFPRLHPRLLARLLDLSSEQRDRSRELFRDSAEAARPLREEMRSLRAELRRRLDDPGTDDATISRLARQIHDLHGRLGEKRAAFVEGFEALLTPRQKERFETLRELRQQFRDLRRGGGRAGLERGP